MGWQIFSLANFSTKGMIGNPFSLYSGSIGDGARHVRILNIRGLKEFFEINGLMVENIRGAGYYPLPAALGDIDVTHSAFITFKIRKMKDNNNFNALMPN